MPEQTDQPLLSDRIYEKLCEARRYPGKMITHAWDATLQAWINEAMSVEQARKQDKERIRELEDERKWIPVAETLPEAGKLVMVWSPFDEHGCGGYGFDMIDENCDDGTTWQEHNSSYEHYVAVSGQVPTIGPSETARYTHWQPLPAPPTNP